MHAREYITQTAAPGTLHIDVLTPLVRLLRPEGLASQNAGCCNNTMTSNVEAMRHSNSYIIMMPLLKHIDALPRQRLLVSPQPLMP